MALNKDKKNLKQHLKNYIYFQVSQGYEPEDVKKLLIENGYSKKLLEEITKEQGNIHSQINPKISKRELSDDLKVYIQNLLIDFILKEREQGYDFPAIKKALVNYGHSSDLVDSAIEAVKNKKDRIDIADIFSSKSKKNRQSSVKGMSPWFVYSGIIFAIICFTIYLSIATGAEITIVIASFMPLVVGISANYFAVLQFKSSKNMRLLPPVTVALIAFIYVGMMQFDSPLKNMGEPTVILVLNILGGFIFSSVICFLTHWPHLGEKPLKQEKILPEHNKYGVASSLEQDLLKEDKKLENMLDERKDKTEKLELKDL
ncbi:MAG: hypothetical protein ACQESF_01655 [Nanobdellota archaeon]